MNLSIEEKVQFLSDKINELSDDFNEDYVQLTESGVEESLVAVLIEDSLIKEIEKIVTAFEAFNPGVYIYGIKRVFNEDGDLIVNLDWYESE